MFTYGHVHGMNTEVREQLARASFLLLPCGPQRMNFGLGGKNYLLPTEPFLRPYDDFLYLTIFLLQSRLKLFIFLTNFLQLYLKNQQLCFICCYYLFFVCECEHYSTCVWESEENFPESVPANFVEAFCLCYSACSRLAGCELPVSCTLYTHSTV